MKYTKYLLTEKRMTNPQEGWKKIIRTVKSCKTQAQLDLAIRMASRYFTQTRDYWTDDAIDRYTEPMEAVMKKELNKAIRDAQKRIK